MGRIFTGLVKCGAWGCFDEFNRLEEQTLSAVSMQIQPIQSALRSKARSGTVTIVIFLCRGHFGSEDRVKGKIPLWTQYHDHLTIQFRRKIHVQVILNSKVLNLRYNIATLRVR